MAFTIYRTFPAGETVYAVVQRTLFRDDPPTGPVVGQAPADSEGTVELPLHKAGQGPPDQFSGGLLRCVATTGPDGPRVTIHPRRTAEIESKLSRGDYPATPW